MSRFQLTIDVHPEHGLQVVVDGEGEGAEVCARLVETEEGAAVELTARVAGPGLRKTLPPGAMVLWDEPTRLAAGGGL